MRAGAVALLTTALLAAAAAEERPHAGAAAGADDDEPMPRPQAAGAARVRVALADGSAVEGRLVVADDARVVVETGGQAIELPRARVREVRPLGPAAAPVAVVGQRAAAARHRGIYLALGVQPRWLQASPCGGCAGVPAAASGYSVSGSLGVGAAVGRRFRLGVEGAVGAGSIGATTTVLADLLAVARVIAVGGLFVEVGAGAGWYGGRVGFGARQGIGWELPVGRSLAFAPALTVTEQVGALGLERLSVDGQVQVRWYL